MILPLGTRCHVPVSWQRPLDGVKSITLLHADIINALPAAADTLKRDIKKNK